MTNQITALPAISTLQLSPGQRALGRMTRLQISSDVPGPAQSDLAADIFHSLYQAAPEHVETVPDERSVNRAVIDWARDMQSWESTRATTVANMPVSMATASLMYEMLSSEEALSAALKKQAEADTLAEQARAMEAQAQGYEAAEMDNEAAQARANAEYLREQANKAASQAQQSVQGARQDAMNNAAVAQAVRRASQAGREMAETMSGWGLGAGSDVRTDPEAALKFMQKNSVKLRQIARLAGRLRGIALQARRERVTHGPIPSHVALTQDLTRVFPSELALLRPEVPAVLRAGKIAQYADAGLIGWKLAGQAQKRGPFVAEIDGSGSMNGNREIVAKAIALGIAHVAKSEGRDYILNTFGYDNDPIISVQSAQSWAEHLDWAAWARGGGTSFNIAMTDMMDKLAAMGKRGHHADALFISDGEADVADEIVERWHAFKAETGARLLYVPVADGFGAMEEIADLVIKLSELDDQSGEGLVHDLAQWME